MLLSTWFFGLLIGLAVTPLAAWLGLELRRRRRRRAGRPALRGWRLVVLRTVAPVLAVVLSVAAVLDGVNRHFSYIPTFQALVGNVSPDLVHRAPVEVAASVAMPDHGVVQQLKVAGTVSGVEPRDTFVYLPPQYFDPRRPHRRFPVLYMLHGSPGISLDWLRGGYVDRAMDAMLTQHQLEPFIVVLPDFNGGYRRDTECQDIVNGPQVQTYLTTDVVRFVDDHFRTIRHREGRAVGGLSTGGYCAINLGLRHQDVFSAIVSHSGYFKPDLSRYSGDLFGGNRALQLANTPAAYLPTIPITQPLGVYLDVGAGDRVSRRQSDMIDSVLTARDIAVTYHVVPGESHTWVAWRQNLYLSLPWLSSWFEAHNPGGGDVGPRIGLTALRR